MDQNLLLPASSDAGDITESSEQAEQPVSFISFIYRAKHSENFPSDIIRNRQGGGESVRIDNLVDKVFASKKSLNTKHTFLKPKKLRVDNNLSAVCFLFLSKQTVPFCWYQHSSLSFVATLLKHMLLPERFQFLVL